MRKRPLNLIGFRKTLHLFSGEMCRKHVHPGLAKQALGRYNHQRHPFQLAQQQPKLEPVFLPFLRGADVDRDIKVEDCPRAEDDDAQRSPCDIEGSSCRGGLDKADNEGREGAVWAEGGHGVGKKDKWTLLMIGDAY